ncbi:ABC transporter ATP-binding protein [Marinobacterium mangrovicola]|uniref:Spermidine/putrescine import ATP-binding protein PotA n=1 Tax=Marinobacterium mangrovicola TaxID=1476959 RepID=A0A4R1G3Q1_9GAMM|nr:ABC transporter ATP-binding protein [Marinobacterium mangrovicola]TCK02274.1 putative spermidine/putrescine transport system ATP-binding protein [Marinobacterium mangrovicola]
MNTSHSSGVSIQGASKSYGETQALKPVNLEIKKGEFVSLLGPSGSGKTTLLGLLGGFVMPSSGSIWVDGKDMTFTPPHKREIGIVFQSYALFPHMTVGENVAFPLRARRLPKSTWPEKVKNALAMVELDGYQDRNIAALSGGQRQRVALARAMVFEPSLILMDEPLSALDKQLRENMQIELRNLHKRLGATIVYVTHDQGEALTMSDRVAILRNGELVQIGAPEELHNNPKDSFVADFIGDSTLVAATRIDGNRVKVGSAELTSARALPDSNDLLLSIQTEKLLIDDGTQPDCVNRLSGKVTDVVYQGDSLRVYLELENGKAITLRQPSHYTAAQQIPAIGETLKVALHPEDTIVVPQCA